MSNPLAIAAVTSTLRHLLDAGINLHIPGTTVTTKPLDKAFTNGGGNSVNLFLYQTGVNPAMCNMDDPNEFKHGEVGTPPLALNLFYLLTAFGESDDETDPATHKLMGYAMSILHNHSILGRDEIRDALTDNDLHQQYERVRITPLPLNMDEQSKLWTGFQTQYRLSTAYQASVVLLDSLQNKKMPLPVLRRGKLDRGVDVLLGPFPNIEKFIFPKPYNSAQLGDSFEIQGENLSGEKVTVEFRHPDLAQAIQLPAEAGSTDKKIVLSIPKNPTNQTTWLAGLYRVVVNINDNIMSNTLAFPLAPQLSAIDPALLTIDNNQEVNLQLRCSPTILPQQRVYLLIGTRIIASQEHLEKTDTLNFIIPNAQAGEYLLRLRVDGIDSMPYISSTDGLSFDSAQKVVFE